MKIQGYIVKGKGTYYKVCQEVWENYEVYLFDKKCPRNQWVKDSSTVEPEFFLDGEKIPHELEELEWREPPDEYDFEILEHPFYAYVYKNWVASKWITRDIKTGMKVFRKEIPPRSLDTMAIPLREIRHLLPWKIKYRKFFDRLEKQLDVRLNYYRELEITKISRGEFKRIFVPFDRKEVFDNYFEAKNYVDYLTDFIKEKIREENIYGNR